MLSAPRITAIETIAVRVHRLPAIQIITAHGTRAASNYVILKVHTSNGMTGLGEATVDVRWNGEDAVTAIRCIKNYLAPEVIGESPLNIERIARKMDARAKENPFAKAAIEMACWDLAGKLMGVPAYELLGGKVRDRIRTKFVVAATTPDRAAEVAREYVALGFDTVKVKVGVNPHADVERVKAVRVAVGPDVLVTVDANTGWTVPDAIWALRQLEDCDLTVAEQPVQARNPRLLAEVRRAVHVPIMADESVFSLNDAAAVVQQDAADVLSLYPGKHGGILQAKKLAHFAGVCGIGATIGSNLELGIGSAAMAHYGVSTPEITADAYPADVIGTLYHDHSLITDASFVKYGYAEAPTGPGLGVELDEDAVRTHRLSDSALDEN